MPAKRYSDRGRPRYGLYRHITWIGIVFVTRENRNPGASMAIVLMHVWLYGGNFPNGQQTSKLPTVLVHK